MPRICLDYIRDCIRRGRARNRARDCQSASALVRVWTAWHDRGTGHHSTSRAAAFPDRIFVSISGPSQLQADAPSIVHGRMGT